MIYYNNDNLIIRSMMKSDIEKFVDGFTEQGWHKSYELFDEYYNQQENNEKLVIVAEIDGNVAENLARDKNDYVSLSVGLHNGYASAQRMYVKRGYIPDGTGVWYNRNQLEPYTKCENDDDLTLYFLKSLKE
jgi:hypothetical protein